MGYVCPKFALVLLVTLTITMSSVGEGLESECPHCHAMLPSLNTLEWHIDQSAPCRVVRAMKAAEDEAGRVEPTVFEYDDNNFVPPAGPFYDETVDLIIEDDVAPALGDEQEELVEEAEAGGAGDAPREFDSALETALWMNTAGQGGTKLPNRSRNEWLKLMKDERYRLEECLSKWRSHRDMDLTIMKAAVGNVRGFIC